MKTIKQMIIDDVKKRVLDLDKEGTMILAFHIVAFSLLISASVLEVILKEGGVISGVTIGILMIYGVCFLCYLINIALIWYKENRI